MGEDKSYSVIGTVTIGSDEYRDLIVDAVRAQSEADRYRTDYWRERDTIKALREELASVVSERDAVREELARYKKYIKANKEEDALDLWILKSIKVGE